MQTQFSLAWNLGFSPELTGRRKMPFDGRTLAEIVEDVRLPHEFASRGMIRINGIEIHRANWSKVRLNEKSPVPLAVTLHIAPRDPSTAIVATTASKTSVGAALTAAAINFAVGLALQLVVNALTSKPGQQEAERLPENTASLDANVLDVNQALPRVIGTHRVFPPLLAHPLVEVVGQDEYVEAVMALAGPHKIDQVYSGDALLYDRVVGASEIEGIEIEVREGFSTDDPVTTVSRQSYTDETRYELSGHRMAEGSTTVLHGSSVATANTIARSGAGVFVIGSTNGFYSSANGADWTLRSSTTRSIRSIIWTGSSFLAVGLNGANYRSVDGLTWTQRADYESAFGVPVPVYGNALNGTNYVTVGSGDGSWTRSTNNGSTWATVVRPWTEIAYDVVSYPGGFLAVGADGRVATSATGATWTSQNGLRATAWGAAADVLSVVWSGTQFVAVGESGRVATSPDGITWTNRAGLSATAWGAGTARSVVWTGTQFVVTGDQGRVATSPDGVTWTNRLGLSTSTWSTAAANVVFASGTDLIIAGASDGTATSANGGVAWTYNSPFGSDTLPQWHTVATREAPDEFWLTINAVSGLLDGDTQDRFIRVPFRFQMRARGAAVWQNLPEIHLQGRNTGQIKAQVKFRWGVYPGAKKLPAQLGWVFGSPRTQSQAVAPASPAWTTSAYWGDTGAYSYRTSTFNGSLSNMVLDEHTAEFWLNPGVFPKGRYEFRVKRGYAVDSTNFSPAAYTISGAVKDMFHYQMSAGVASIQEDQQNRSSQIYLGRASSIWNEHPTPISGDMALIAIRAKNQQMPAIHCTASGWVNDWDGAGWNTLTTTSNPAPHYRYLLSSGISNDPLPASMINDASIVAWRTHCATKGYQCNMVVQDISLKDALNRTAGCGYAVPVQSEVWGVSHERDRTNEAVVQVFTPANSRNFTYKKGFARFVDALRCQFRNSDENFEPREEIVFAVGANTTDPRLEQADYLGLVTEAEVTKRAGYELKERESRNVFYTLEADADALVCRRGDLVVVQSDVLTGQAVAGSVLSKTVVGPNITSLTLDAAVELGAGPNTVVVRGFDGTIRTASVSQASVTTNVLTLTSAMPNSVEIDDGSLVAVGQSGQSLRRLIVTDISPGQDLTCTITLADEAPELLALI